MTDGKWPQIESGKPACYRIAVQGCLDEKKWSGRLGGLQIASQKEDDQHSAAAQSGAKVYVPFEDEADADD